LRKKEEQLKLKEVAINDTMTEKTRILDRMYKAEDRNLEMEHTVKNLQNRIEMLESRKTLQGLSITCANNIRILFTLL
jgi:uncharacterized coiled-coil protein SlyX